MKRVLSALVAAILSVFWASAAWADSASTPISDDSAARRDNIALAAASINGLVLEDGDSFSFNSIVGDRTQGNGFKAALNGRGVRVVGGGVAQVATTLYLAVRDMEGVEIDERHTYGDRFSGGYVDSGNLSVAVDDGEGLDFRFTNQTGGRMTLYVSVSDENVACWVEESRSMLSSAYTYVFDGSDAMLNNLSLCAQSINATVIPAGGILSFNELVGARTEDRGYEVAPNGRGVNVVGGGVAQVASTLYLAALEAGGLEVTELHTYGGRYTGDYVDSGDQAVLVDYNSDLDFKIQNNTGEDVVVYVGLSEDAGRVNCEFWVG